MKYYYPSKVNSWQLFDTIAPRYDFLNRLLSLQIDKRWRSHILNYLPKGNNLKILDIATGTGDLLFTLAKNRRVRKAIGIDMSHQMLKIARYKARSLDYGSKISFERQNAEQLLFPNNSFDFCSIAFGLRNFKSPEKVLNQIHQTLKPNASLCILELSIPHNSLIKAIYLLYFRYILPYIGGFISGHATAYRYLNHTVEEFPQREELVRLLHRVGFKKVEYCSFTFGIATLYYAKRLLLK